MKHFITLLFVITLYAGEMYAATPADSIRKEMKHLKGEKLLQTYHNLCRLAAAEDNMGYELRCIREYLAESLRQKDKEAKALTLFSQAPSPSLPKEEKGTVSLIPSAEGAVKSR